jgi:putative restriction endonuclease
MSSIYEWATPENLQPEPITGEVWRNLPEEFRRQVEVVSGQAVRREAPDGPHQAAARSLATVLDTAANNHMALHPGPPLNVSNDFDVLLWDAPVATIRRPDVALHNQAPNGLRPVPASYIRVVGEVVSAASDWTDRAAKMGEYAAAGIPFYWLAWLVDDNVASIDVRFLDHSIGAYRLLRTLGPEDEVSMLDVPIRITVPWNQLPLYGPLAGPLPRARSAQRESSRPRATTGMTTWESWGGVPGRQPLPFRVKQGKYPSLTVRAPARHDCFIEDRDEAAKAQRS